MLVFIAPSAVRGTAIRERIAAETANVAASNASAVPTPSPTTSAPPSAGPASRIASGRLSWLSEFAWVSTSRSTSSGTIAP